MRRSLGGGEDFFAGRSGGSLRLLHSPLVGEGGRAELGRMRGVGRNEAGKMGRIQRRNAINRQPRRSTQHPSSDLPFDKLRIAPEDKRRSGSGAQGQRLPNFYTWREPRAPPASVATVDRSRAPLHVLSMDNDARMIRLPSTKHWRFAPECRPVGRPRRSWEPNPRREVTAALPIPGPEPVPARAMPAIMREGQGM